MPNSTIQIKSGFADGFFKESPPDAAAIATPAAEAASNEEGGGGSQEWVSYRPEQYGSHSAFLSSPDFPVFKSQFTNALTFLSDYAEHQQHSASADIKRNFQLFSNHRFEGGGDFFSTRAEIVDGIGMRALNEFCQHIRHAKLPSDLKCTEIHELSQGVTLCADGAASNLAMSARNISLKSGGLSAKLWETKEATVRKVIQELLSGWFQALPSYPNNEIHYVNALWNCAADFLGLKKIEDAFSNQLIFKPSLNDARLGRRAQSHHIHDGMLAELYHAIIKQMTAARLLGNMAEEALSLFKDAIPLSQDSLASGWFSYTSETQQQITHALEWVREQYDPSLQPGSFIKLNEVGYDEFQFQPCATLIAVDMLHALDQKGLLSQQPEWIGTWQSSDNPGQLSIFKYGDELMWAVRHSNSKSFANMGASADKLILTVAELNDWLIHKKNSPDADGDRSIRLIKSAIKSSSLQELMGSLPDLVAKNNLLVRQLFEQLGTGNSKRYLTQHLSFFANHFPNEERAELVDHWLGSDVQSKRLFRHWYPQQVDMLREVRQTALMFQNESRLAQLMRESGTRAIDSIGARKHHPRHLFNPGTVTSAELQNALYGAQEGSSVLTRALVTREPEVVAAWGRLLKAPGVAQTLGSDGLYQLLATQESSTGASASKNQTLLSPLGLAIQHRRPAMIDALKDIICDTAVLQVLSPHLPALLNRMYGATRPEEVIRPQLLQHAAFFAGSDCLRSYLDLLLDPGVLDVLTRKGTQERPLRSMLIPNSSGLIGLLISNSKFIAVKQLLDFLKKPAVVDAMSDDFKVILTRGHGDLFSLMVVHSDRFEERAHELDLLKLSYLDFLADEHVSSKLSHQLSDILLAPRPDGVIGLHELLRHGSVGALAQCYDLLLDSTLSPALIQGGQLHQMLLTVDATGVSTFDLAMQSGRPLAVRLVTEMMERSRAADLQSH